MSDSDSSSSSLSEPAPSCSNHFEDLDPDVRDKFGRLAAVLKETNQNLVTFEFLLSHYRSLARVAPLPASPGAASSLAAVTPLQSLTNRGGGLENRVDSEEILDLLRNISQSVEGFRDQLHVAAVSVEEGVGDVIGHIEVDGLGETAAFKDVEILEQDRKLVEKDKEIIELKTMLIKMEKELLEERQVAEVRADLTKQMEKKLDSERLAAKEMAKEIRYYVEKLSKLEARKSVELVKVDRCVGTVSDGLQNLCNPPQRSVEKVDRCVSTEGGELDKFSAKLFKTVEKLDQCVGTETGDQVVDANASFCDKIERLEHELLQENDTNQELVVKNEELGERLRQAERNVAAKEESRVRLKSKTRTLLKQYRMKRTSVEKKDLQLSKLRQGLLHLRSLCENIECNYQVILHHLGAQIHVAARLMSLHHPNHAIPAELPGKMAGLGAWFQEIQGMASWLQKSVAMLGVVGTVNIPEMDMSRSTVYRRVRGEQDTQSDMSNAMLDEEAALEAVRVCEAGLNEQNTTVNSLIGCIDIF